MRAEIMEILRSVDAQFEPIANGEFQPEIDEMEQPATADDDDSGIFASADRNAFGFMMNDDDDTILAEPTPSKQPGGDMDIHDSSEKENRDMPTLSDNYMDDEL
jgi:hypothetical protein